MRSRTWSNAFRATASEVAKAQKVVYENAGKGSIECDVFLSYATPDLEMAMRLFEFLKAHGFRTFFSTETWKHEAGPNWIMALQWALEHSRDMIVVLSPASIRSDWVTHEWTAFFRKVGPASRLIPLSFQVFEPEDLPSFLGNLQIRPVDGNTALEFLLEKLHQRP